MRDLAPRLALLLVALSALTMALASSAVATSHEPFRSQAMPVMIGNRRIVVLRGPIAGHTATERAEGATQRILAALASSPDTTVTLADAEDGKATRVLIGGRFAFLITPIDINTEIGETTQIVAREAAARLREATAEWHELRTPRYLARATAMAVGATLAYAAILWLLFGGTRWVARRLSAAAAVHSQKVRVGGVRLLNAGQVLWATRLLLTLVTWVVALALGSGWLGFVLEQFPYTQPWGEGLRSNLIELLGRVAWAVAGAIPGLVVVAVVVLIARLIIRLVAVFFDRIEAGSVRVAWLDSDTVRPTRRIFNLVVWLFALAMAYPYLPGSDTEAFKGLSVLVGLMLTFGGASIVGQAFSGLILMYAKAFRRGDYVRIGETEGTVVELGMFATKVRTGMGEEITLPNAGVMATTTKNYSRAVPGTGYIVDTVVTIGYPAPWRQVQAMLVEAARRTGDIAPTPAPMVRQTA